MFPTKSPTIRAGAVAVAVLAGASSAAAQSSAAAPTRQTSERGFNGAPARGETANNGVVVTVAEAYDEDVLGDVNSPKESSLQTGGFFSELNAAVNLRAGSRRTQFLSSAGTDFRYYTQQQEVVGIGHYGTAGVSYASPDTNFSVNGGVAYAPSYLHRLFTSLGGGAPIGDAVATGFAITDTSSYSYDSRASYSHNLTRRNRLTFRASGRFTDFRVKDAGPGTTVLRDLGTYDAGADFSRGLSRDVRLNLGYTYRRAQYYTGVYPTEHNFNVGFDIDRPLSRTRRTHLRVNATTVILDAVAPGDGSGLLRRQYRAAGDVALSHQFGRTWQADGAYRRGVGYIEGLVTPVLTDGFSVSTAGHVSRKVDLLANASYSVGEPAVFGQASGFTTYEADARLRTALTHDWALFGEYRYYYYDFSRGLVPIGVPPTLGRNSVRAGLMVWLPF